MPRYIGKDGLGDFAARLDRRLNLVLHERSAGQTKGSLAAS